MHFFRSLTIPPITLQLHRRCSLTHNLPNVMLYVFPLNHSRYFSTYTEFVFNMYKKQKKKRRKFSSPICLLLWKLIPDVISFMLWFLDSLFVSFLLLFISIIVWYVATWCLLLCFSLSSLFGSERRLCWIDTLKRRIVNGGFTLEVCTRKPLSSFSVSRRSVPPRSLASGKIWTAKRSGVDVATGRCGQCKPVCRWKEKEKQPLRHFMLFFKRDLTRTGTVSGWCSLTPHEDYNIVSS